MVCVAAFIILCLMSVFVAGLSIFFPKIGKKWWEIFKKAWGCVGKRVTFKKCDTNFKDDIKNTILRKIVFKKPKLVKPISAAIEILSVFIVFITIWSLIIGIKSLLALWVFDTCNVSKPSQCGLGSESCSIDSAGPKDFWGSITKSISEWGEIFGAIPDRLKNWEAKEYLSRLEISENKEGERLAIKVFDPGCVVCMQSFKNQIENGFNKKYRIVFLPYIIRNEKGEEKFKNSETIVRYILAAEKINGSGYKIIHKLFTEFNEDNINYQTVLTEILEKTEVEKILSGWLDEIAKNNKLEILEILNSEEINQIIIENKKIVEEKIKTKIIPVLIYDGKKKTGLYK